MSDGGADGGIGTRFATAEQSPGLALWRVTNRWQARMRAALAPHGLTHVQYVLLASLVWLEHRDPRSAPTQAELAEHAEADVMMTSQVVRALEGKHLVERSRHPADGRAWLLRPTESGRRAARLATRDVEDADADFFGRLQDQPAFCAELELLVQAAEPSAAPST